MIPSLLESPPARPARSGEVLLWWRVLCAIAVLNVCLWIAVWQLGPSLDVYGSWQLFLSGIYVLVCAYRSVLPRVDLERMVVIDSRLSSIFLGRLAATVAEICFGLQLGLLVHELGAKSAMPWVQAAAWAVPMFVIVAQVFCWHSVLTLNHMTQAVESALWAAGSAWMAVLLAFVSFEIHGTALTLATVGIAGSVLFVTYVLAVDVPMYLRRYREGKAAGRKYLSLSAGAYDAWERREPSHHWERWKADACWLTPYFSAGVWFSIALVFASQL